MTSKDSALRLDKELGIIEKIVPTSIPEILPNIVEVSGDDIEDDYKYQRDSFYNLVDKGSVAIDGILELAKESEHPRTYEVAGQLIKSVAEVAEKLGDLQEKMRKLKRCQAMHLKMLQTHYS